MLQARSIPRSFCDFLTDEFGAALRCVQLVANVLQDIFDELLRHQIVVDALPKDLVEDLTLCTKCHAAICRLISGSPSCRAMMS